MDKKNEHMLSVYESKIVQSVLQDWLYECQKSRFIVIFKS